MASTVHVVPSLSLTSPRTHSHRSPISSWSLVLVVHPLGGRGSVWVSLSSCSVTTARLFSACECALAEDCTVHPTSPARSKLKENLIGEAIPLHVPSQCHAQYPMLL